MAALIPDFLQFTAHLACDTIEQAVNLAVDALHACGLSPIATWDIPAGDPAAAATPSGHPVKLQNDCRNAGYHLANGDGGGVYHPYGQTYWAINLLCRFAPNPARSLLEVLTQHAQMCRRLMQEKTFLSAKSDWIGIGALCLPEVPLAEIRAQLVATTAAAVEDAYDAPEVFWQAWPEREEIGGASLLLRATQAENSVQFLQAVQSQQWAMARAAKAGRIRIMRPEVHASEQALFEAGERTLYEVGYIAADKVFEMACALTPPYHIHGWEIYRLRGLILAGAAIRVVFAYEEMARAERRVLLTIGAQILYYDAAGALKTLEA